MKKAQILSAIALAFALGVVAPVASTYAESRASVTTPDATATDAEVNAVISSIEAQPEYKAYAALKSALATTATDTTLDGLQNTIATAIKTVTGANYDGEDTLAATIAAAKNTTNYDKWAALVAATTDDSTSTSEDQKVAAIKAAAAALNLNVTLEDGDGLAELQTAVADNADYKKYQPLVAAVNDAEEKQAAVNTAVSDLKTALAGVNVDARDITTAAEGDTPITSLKALAPTGTRVTNYNNLIDAVANAKEALESDKNTETANATAITNLKDAYKLASGSDLNVTTPTDPTDPSTTTTIESADGSVSVKGELQAGLVVEAKEAEEKDEMFKKAFGDKKFFVYDIKIKGQNGYVTTFDKDVTVTVKVPEGIDGAKAGIYYVNAEGSASKIASTYNAEAKTLTFTTNHFSYYAIVEDNGVNVSDSGVLAAADGTASSTVAIVAGIATALTAAGAGVVAYRNARRAGKEA